MEFLSNLHWSLCVAALLLFVYIIIIGAFTISLITRSENAILRAFLNTGMENPTRIFLFRIIFGILPTAYIILYIVIHFLTKYW